MLSELRRSRMNTQSQNANVYHRLKAPRGRLHGGISSTGSPSFASGVTSNPFGGSNVQISTPFGNNSNTAASNFSTSASFPPFNPTPPSGTFTFAPQTTSNPFSGLGTSAGNNGGNSVSFGGFGAQTNGPTNPQSDGDTMMESPQKKPPTFGTTFGTGSTATPSPAPFSFGQLSQSAAPSVFGASATAQPSNNPFNFGQSQPAAQPGGLFGPGRQKPEEPKPQISLFGQSTNTAQPTANLFGQPTSAPSSSSIFSPSISAFNPSSNPFGQTPTTSDAPVNTFGSTAPATQPPNGGPFSTLFGQAPANANPTNDAQTSSEMPKPIFNFPPPASKAPFSFSAAAVSTANTNNSSITPQISDLTATSSAPDSAGPVFSGGSTSGPFGAIFKPNANARLGSPDTSTISTESTSTKPNFFNFKPNTSSLQPGLSSNGGLFGTKPSESSTKQNESGTKHSESDTAAGLFGRVTRSEERSSTITAPVTSQKPSQDKQGPDTSRDSSTNASSLLSKVPQPEHTSGATGEPTKPQETTTQLFKGFQPQTSTQQSAPSSISSFSNIFAASSNNNVPAAQKEKQPSKPFSSSSLFAEPSAAGSNGGSSMPAESQGKESSWPAPKATPLPSSQPHSTSALTPSTSSKPPAAPKGIASTASESNIRLRSYGSSAIPAYLDSDESVEHDSLSRLRILNTSFQKTIAKLDPAVDDFEEIVRHYIAQRTRIGHALNLKERNKAGTKRKLDNSEVTAGSLNESKKARTEGFSSESSNVGMPPNATDGSGSATIQAHNAITATSTSQLAPSSSDAGSSSTASGIFKSMMSSPKPTSPAFPSTSGTFKSSSNPFVGLKASAPSSSPHKQSAEPAAPASGTAKDVGQATNPFALLGAPSSTSSGSASVSSSIPLFTPQVPSTTPTKSPPKKPAFEVPKFGAVSGTSFMDAFAKQSAKSAADLQEEAKRKRKAEDFDSDEDDEAEWERKYEEAERAKRNKLESLSKTGATGFQPLFGGKETSATAKNFFNLANDTASKTSSAHEKTSAPAGFAGFNSASTAGKTVEEPVNISDEDSNDSNGSRSSREQEGSASQEEGSGQGSEEDETRDEEEEEEEEGEGDVSDGDYDQQEDEEDAEEQESEEESEDEDIQAAMTRSKSKGSLFDRIEPNPNLKSNGTFHSGAQKAQKKSNGTSSKVLEEEARPNDSKAPKAVNSSFKPFGANGVLSPSAVNSTPDAPTISPFTPINGSSSNIRDPFAPVGPVSSKKPVTKEASTSARTNGEAFSFKTDNSLSAPALARSVLFGGNSSLVSGTIPGEGLFGSRPSTPGNDEPSRGSVFSNLGTGPNFSKSPGDYSWKPGTPVKFGTPEKGGPTVNVTAATPPAKDDSAAASKSFPNLFGPKPSKPGADAVASVGFNFGGPSHLTASPLLGPSALSSAVSSRATSPGATDTESVNTDTGEDHSDEPQVSLMSSRPGEENEEVLFEARSKALKYITDEMAKEKKLDPGFSTQGVGQLRVLKHKTTGKTRLLLRAEPGSNIVINTALTPSMTYKATETKGSGAMKFGIPTATGIDHWVVKVKTAAMAEELAGILEANKGEAIQN